MGGVGDDAEGAGGDGLFDVAIAVGRAALHGDEDGAGADAAGVVFDAGDGRGGVAGGPDGRDFIDQFFQFMLWLIVDCPSGVGFRSLRLWRRTPSALRLYRIQASVDAAS